MAKKAASNSDRSDPKQNKSLAIRIVLGKMPTAKASEIVAAVKKEFGHDIGQNMVYMVKTKKNMATDGRPSKDSRRGNGSTSLNSAAQWVGAIKTAKQLLQHTGSVDNAVALLKAIAI